MERVARSRGRAAPGGPEALGGDVYDVEERYAHRRLDGRVDEVHGYGADDDALGIGRFQRPGCLAEVVAGLVPSARPLHVEHGLEVHRARQDVGRAPAAEALAHRLVDHPVVDGGALEAHRAEKTNPAHAVAPCSNLIRPGAPASPEWDDPRQKRLDDDGEAARVPKCTGGQHRTVDG